MPTDVDRDEWTKVYPEVNGRPCIESFSDRCPCSHTRADHLDDSRGNVFSGSDCNNCECEKFGREFPGQLSETQSHKRNGTLTKVTAIEIKKRRRKAAIGAVALMGVLAGIFVHPVFALTVLILAAELRSELLVGTTGDADTGDNADAEFRNDSSRVLHIRAIGARIGLSAAGIAEVATAEISKSPTIASLTNNNVFWTWPMTIGLGLGDGVTAGNANGDGSGNIGGRRVYGKGQLTLEPNESLFVNTVKSAGGVLDYVYDIEYEFGS